MDIVLDFSGLPTDSPWAAGWWFMTHGLWVVLVIFFLVALVEVWIISRRIKYLKRWEWVTLSIEIPKTNEQYPKAVEHVFTALAGTWKRVDWIERFFLGKVQAQFSFELVSRGGYLEYLIHAPRHYRDLAEAAVYAQYPDAEIDEVPDYTEKYKGVHWPDHDQGYDIWGAEINQTKKYYYPIKTWPEFFDVDAKKGLRDPIFAMLENLAKLKAGEEFWFQIIVSPVSNEWQKKGLEYARKLLGQGKHGSGGGEANIFLRGLWGVVDAVVYSFIAQPEVEVAEKKPPEYLAEESKAIEAMQNKLSKIGFRTGMRLVYIARKEVFNKKKVKEGFLGALHQFADLYGNSFVQDKYSKVSTSHLYYFPKYRVDHFRKNHILYKYRERDMRAGVHFGHGYILNVEELATLWHFPLGNVQSLMIKKAEFKKAEAPFTLPVKTGVEELATYASEERVPEMPEQVSSEQDYGPPDNLPVG